MPHPAKDDKLVSKHGWSYNPVAPVVLGQRALEGDITAKKKLGRLRKLKDESHYIF